MEIDGAFSSKTLVKSNYLPDCTVSHIQLTTVCLQSTTNGSRHILAADAACGFDATAVSCSF
jgi:hypothetical protein